MLDMSKFAVLILSKSKYGIILDDPTENPGQVANFGNEISMRRMGDYAIIISTSDAIQNAEPVNVLVEGVMVKGFGSEFEDKKLSEILLEKSESGKRVRYKKDLTPIEDPDESYA